MQRCSINWTCSSCECGWWCMVPLDIVLACEKLMEASICCRRRAASSALRVAVAPRSASTCAAASLHPDSATASSSVSASGASVPPPAGPSTACASASSCGTSASVRAVPCACAKVVRMRSLRCPSRKAQAAVARNDHSWMRCLLPREHFHSIRTHVVSAQRTFIPDCLSRFADITSYAPADPLRVLPAAAAPAEGRPAPAPPSTPRCWCPAVARHRHHRR